MFLTVLFSSVLFWYSAEAVRRPNILVIMTDDQDAELGSLRAMPKLRKIVTRHGLEFKNTFVTTPVCCPSRAAFISGRYVHNNRAYNNSVEGGCGGEFFQRAMESTSFPKLLHDSGYRTFYAGKYLNRYGTEEAGGPGQVPRGWDWFSGLIINRRFFNYNMSINGTLVQYGSHIDDYHTNVIKSHAKEFLRGIDNSTPFLMVLAPYAPHTPADSVPPYTGWFRRKRAPRTPHYRKYAPDKHWVVSSMPRTLPAATVAKIDEIYRKRLQSLQPVDGMIEELFNQLRAADLLNNTYIIFTSDNGYQLGQYNLPYDKRHLYEFDTKVPLIIRGPGVRKGQRTWRPVLLLDLAPTIADLAGLEIPDYFDGRSFRPILEGRPKTWRRSFLIEYYGEIDVNQRCTTNQGCCLAGCVCVDARNNTYNCVRTVHSGENTVYCEFLDDVGFVEFYDLKKDPFQLRNAAGWLSEKQKKKLRKELNFLKTCAGKTCRGSMGT